MYVTTEEVYQTAGITKTEIPTKWVEDFIKAAEAEVDRMTNTTYWIQEDCGTVESATADTLTETGKFAGKAFLDYYVWIYKGTGSGQVRTIESFTENTLTVDRDWTTALDTTSKYRIIYTHTEAYKEEIRDGDGTNELFSERFPLIEVDKLSISDTEITNSNIYKYKDEGKLVLSTGAEVTYFSANYPQQVELSYWFGVFKIPWEVKRLALIYASLKALMAQAGGTFNVPSTYSLPEGSVTIGQAYVNIRGAWDMLDKERVHLESQIAKYASIY